MSRLWVYLKNDLKLNMAQLPNLLMIYVGVPLFFTVIMGFSFSNSFIPETSFEPIKIALVNEDEGEFGARLVDVFQAEEMAAYLEHVEDADDADFRVVIEEDYSNRLAQTPISIHAAENTSSSQEAMLTQLVESYQQNLVNRIGLNDAMRDVGRADSAEFLSVQLAEVEAIQVSNVFEKKTFQSDAALNSNQFTSVAGLIFVFVLGMSSSVGLKTQAELKGLRKRLEILPLTVFQDVVYSVISNTVIYTLLGIIYIGIWRLIDVTTFAGNPLYYLMWLVIYSFFFQALNNGLYYFVPEKYIMVVYQTFNIFFMILGFLPMDQILSGEVGMLFEQNYFRQIFSQPFYDFVLSGNWGANLEIAVGLVVVSVVVIVFIIWWRNRKEFRVQ